MVYYKKLKKMHVLCRYKYHNIHIFNLLTLVSFIFFCLNHTPENHILPPAAWSKSISVCNTKCFASVKNDYILNFICNKKTRVVVTIELNNFLLSAFTWFYCFIMDLLKKNKTVHNLNWFLEFQISTVYDSAIYKTFFKITFYV